MAKAKDKQLTEDEKALLRAEGLQWMFWSLIQRKRDYIIAKNTYTGEVRMFRKSKIPS